MSKNINNNQFDKETLDQDKINKLEGKILGLTGNILALRIELISEHKKFENYFKILSKQIYEMKKDLDFVRSYLDIAIEEVNKEDHDCWISVS